MGRVIKLEDIEAIEAKLEQLNQSTAHVQTSLKGKVTIVRSGTREDYPSSANRFWKIVEIFVENYANPFTVKCNAKSANGIINVTDSCVVNSNGWTVVIPGYTGSIATGHIGGYMNARSDLTVTLYDTNNSIVGSVTMPFSPYGHGTFNTKEANIGPAEFREV